MLRKLKKKRTCRSRRELSSSDEFLRTAKKHEYESEYGEQLRKTFVYAKNMFLYEGTSMINLKREYRTCIVKCLTEGPT